MTSSYSTVGIQPRGAVFAGAFTDLATLLETYNVGGWIPLLQPFQLVPFFFSKSIGFIYTRSLMPLQKH
jgi:abhydrolase domain-containing protein 12